MSQLPTLDELKGATLPASELSAETENNPDRLHGWSRRPEYVLTHEKPWHRAAAYLFATGCVSTREVATACNVSEPTVRNLLRHDWFQERVTKLMGENGGKDIMSMFRAEQFRTLAVLLDLRDNLTTPAPVKFNVCRDILDRTLGKPVQRIETEDKTQSDDPVAEAKRLEEELQRTRGEQ